MEINRDWVRQWVNFVAIIAAFSTNVLANVAPINDLTIGEISQTFFGEVLITPASYAFAIWGLIYLGLISLAIYQVLPANQQHPRLRRMGCFLAVSSLAQIVWVFLFQYRLFVLSVLGMIAILIPLIWLYLRLEIALESVSSKQRWLVNFPVSIYLGWISVATILNIALGLYHLKWNGWGISPQFWTIIMVVVASLIAGIIRLKRQDLVYCGVSVWALIAIAIRHLDTVSIAATALTLAVLLIFIMVIPKLYQLKQRRE